MRLINTGDLRLEEFFGDKIPPYAILSHTWREAEVTLQDWHDEGRRHGRHGWPKIDNAIKTARLLGLFLHSAWPLCTGWHFELLKTEDF